MKNRAESPYNKEQKINNRFFWTTMINKLQKS